MEPGSPNADGSPLTRHAGCRTRAALVFSGHFPEHLSSKKLHFGLCQKAHLAVRLFPRVTKSVWQTESGKLISLCICFCISDMYLAPQFIYLIPFCKGPQRISFSSGDILKECKSIMGGGDLFVLLLFLVFVSSRVSKCIRAGFLVHKDSIFFWLKKP